MGGLRTERVDERIEGETGKRSATGSERMITVHAVSTLRDTAMRGMNA